MGTSVVLDACVVVALAGDEPYADRIETRLRMLGPDDSPLISAVNWCEVLYVVRRALGDHAAARAAELMHAVGISVVDVDAELAAFAAEVKSQHGLGLGDSFAAGLALATGSPLLTCDSDFLALGDAGLRVEWMGA